MERVCAQIFKMNALENSYSNIIVEIFRIEQYTLNFFYFIIKMIIDSINTFDKSQEKNSTYKRIKREANNKNHVCTFSLVINFIFYIDIDKV